MTDELEKILEFVKSDLPLTYEQARELTQHKDISVRSALAAREDAPSEVLYFLASDKAPEVRRAAAANKSMSLRAHLKLAHDSDDGVRTSLAAKIARLVPGLNDNEQDRLRRSTYETLEALARDELTRVREILSETLKDIANAPPEVIRRLAMDTEVTVAGPVLEFSPILTDEDLVDILRAAPSRDSAGAIARRLDISEIVSDAVVDTDDINAIGVLLSNTSAQIREETLDTLIERADNTDLWHAPLVSRPALSSRSARRLAGFVANDLLSTLKFRGDLDAETMEVVKKIVEQRVGAEDNNSAEASETVAKKTAVGPVKVPDSVSLDFAEKLHASGKLNEKILLSAVQSNDYDLVFAGLIVLSGVGHDSIRKIFDAQSAKGIISVVWKSGLSIKLAVTLQSVSAQLPPGDVLGPVGDSEFPLSEDAMNWQLEFFGGQKE